MIPYEPKKIPMPFAYNGARNDIPESGGAETGNASFNDGWSAINSQPLSQGGIPPQRKDFNGILYLLSAYAYYAQAGGLYAWDSEIDYAVNCVVTYGNNIYICIANNGASTSAGVVEPGSDESYWLELFVYLLRASGGNVGSAVNPMYIANGQFVVSTANVGSGTQPMYMNAGTLTASTSTVGADDTPVFLKAGVLTACTSSGGGIADYKRGMPGYIKYDCGIIVQWGTRRTTGNPSSGSGDYTVTFPISFSSSSSYVIMKNINANHGSGHVRESYASFWSLTATTAKTHLSCDSLNTNEQWLAVGY